MTIQKHVDGGTSATVGTTLNELGMLNFNRKQYDAALSYFKQAMDEWKSTLGDQHPFLALAYSNIGSVCLDQKNYVCAESNYREAVRRLDATSKDSLNAAIAHLKLGRSLLREQRFREAESETSFAYKYLLKNVSPFNGFLAASRKDLAAIYMGLDRKEDANRYLSELSAKTPKT